MVNWKLVYTAQARKEAKKIKTAGLKQKVQNLPEILNDNLYKKPPSFEKLAGDLSGTYSRRINIQHRLVYQIYDDLKIVKIIRMWTQSE